jgi:hypothetical protein
MNKKRTRAATDASRIFKKEATGTKQALSNVATASKNKETSDSLFFSRCQRSKVIARVTRNSPVGSFSLRSCIPCSARQRPPAPAPDGLRFGVARQPYLCTPDGRTPAELSCKPPLHLPLVASIAACTAILYSRKKHTPICKM